MYLSIKAFKIYKIFIIVFLYTIENGKKSKNADAAKLAKHIFVSLLKHLATPVANSSLSSNLKKLFHTVSAKYKVFYLSAGVFFCYP